MDHNAVELFFKRHFLISRIPLYPIDAYENIRFNYIFLMRIIERNNVCKGIMIEIVTIQFQQIISYASERIKLVDSSGHYESDDETGFFFKQLKELQLLLSDIFEENEENTNV